MSRSRRGRLKRPRVGDNDPFAFGTSHRAFQSQQHSEPHSEDEEDGHEILFEHPPPPATISDRDDVRDTGDKGPVTASSDEDVDESELQAPLSPRVENFLKPVLASVRLPSGGGRIRATEPQSSEVRRVLNSKYKDLQSASRDDSEMIVNNEGILRGLQMITILNDRTAHVTEELQDAEELSVLADRGYEKSKRRLAHGPAIDYKVYLLAFCERYRRSLAEGEDKIEEIDWVSAGFDTVHLGYQPIVGLSTFTHRDLHSDKPVKQRAAVVRREKDTLKTAKPGSSLSQSSNGSAESTQTDARVNALRQLFKSLTATEPVMLWEFLVDPYSFVGTVENVFDFSFLVKDECRMSWKPQDREKLFPMIQYKAPPMTVSGASASGTGSASQSSHSSGRGKGGGKGEASSAERLAHCTVTLDHQRWRGLIEAFSITKPMIPSRYVVTADDDGSSERPRAKHMSAKKRSRRSNEVANGAVDDDPVVDDDGVESEDY